MENKVVGLVYCKKCEAEHSIQLNLYEEKVYECKGEKLVLKVALQEGKVFYYD